MSGCYPGCFYYTDSCFRKDCKMDKSATHKPAHGGYPGELGVKDRVSDFRAIAEAAYGSTEAYGSMIAESRQAAIAGGLQPHSVGGIYPLCLVAIADEDRIHYEVHDLQRDLVAIQRDYEGDESSSIPEEPRFWTSAQVALNWAELLVDDRRFTVWRQRVGVKRTRGV